MSRWIRVQTDVFEHELFAHEPFTEREAWLWLVAKAAWKATKHRIGQTVVDVPVGSVFLTLREMQAAWRWKSDKRVRSFLAMLEREEMIALKSDAGKTQISVCNYTRYQDAERGADADRTQDGRSADALKTPVHQDTNSSSLRSEEARVPKNDSFEEFWKVYPNKVGKRDAEKAFSRALKRVDLETILSGLQRYVAKTDDRPWCNPATWLNQDRWDDAPADVPQQRASGPPGKTTPFDAYDEIARLKGWTDEPASLPGNYENAERLSAAGGSGRSGTVVDLRRGHDWHP